MLIAQMIGRNESGRYLEEVLDHLSQVVDRIVFTDDCSDDDTAQIAKSKGANVMQTHEPLFVQDESRLRSLAWEHLSLYAKSGDWILAVDCDEKFYPNERLDSLMDQDRFQVLGVTFYHMWNETHYRADKAWAPSVSTRLFRYLNSGEYRNRKLACGAEPLYVQELVRRRQFLPDTGFRMQHLGYARDEDKIAKHARYMELDGGDYHSRAHLESILDPNPLLLRWGN